MSSRREQKRRVIPPDADLATREHLYGATIAARLMTNPRNAERAPPQHAACRVFNIAAMPVIDTLAFYSTSIKRNMIVAAPAHAAHAVLRPQRWRASCCRRNARSGDTRELMLPHAAQRPMARVFAFIIISL